MELKRLSVQRSGTNVSSVRCRGIVWAVLGVALAQGSSASPPTGAAPTPTTADQTWTTVAHDFMEEYFRAQPFFAARAGRHEFDGQLPDLSTSGIQHEIQRLRDARARINDAEPTHLKPRERFDRQYLLTVIDSDLFWLAKARYPFSNPYWYVDELDPDMYLSRNYAPLDVRLRAYIRYARAIPKTVADIQGNLKGPLPKTYVDLGIEAFGGFADFFAKNVGPIFAAVHDADLQRQLVDASARAAVAMNGLKTYLVSLKETATDNFPLGKELFAQMLRDTERVQVPLDRIEAAGRADLERNSQALQKECAVYLPNNTVQGCVAKVLADKPKEGALAEARLQLVQLKKFVRDHNVVSIPSDEEALVAEAPPYNSANAAFIQLPGPYDRGVASIYNIAPPDPKWSKAERDAYIPSRSTLLFTSVHEVWPGHFLQYMHSNANPDKLEGLWVGYAFTEGWAHYCEEMMYEEGLGKEDSAQHIGQIIDALLRDVRLLSSIGMHTEGMTVSQSETMFRERAFQDSGNARQQAARGTYDPAYLNYTLGKLMIRKLRADWVSRAPVGAPSMSGDPRSMWHDFHDAFLSYGGPPIPLLRQELIGTADGLL
jgi:Bacterial protein of unknown function (DUF885)